MGWRVINAIKISSGKGVDLNSGSILYFPLVRKACFGKVTFEQTLKKEEDKPCSYLRRECCRQRQV